MEPEWQQSDTCKHTVLLSTANADEIRDIPEPALTDSWNE